MPAVAVSAAKPPERLSVFAAASLQEGLDEVSMLWEKKSGQDLVVSYAASSALARQIEQGAPADVFVSADQEWMDYLQERQRIVPTSRFDLVGNALVLVAPVDSEQAALTLSARTPLAAALGKVGRLAVAETTSVPAGRYSRQALQHLGLWPQVAGRLAQGDNVRAALAFVARGEAPLGIVYATDALAEPRVRVVARFDASTHERIVYPVARVAGTNGAAAQDFLSFLRGTEARAVFERRGFTVH